MDLFPLAEEVATVRLSSLVLLNLELTIATFSLKARAGSGNAVHQGKHLRQPHLPPVIFLHSSDGFVPIGCGGGGCYGKVLLHESAPT
jgi:hypothetical protein